MSQGEAFQFTPTGVTPLEEPQPVGGVIPAAEAIARIRAQGEAREQSARATPAPKTNIAPAQPLPRGRSLVAQIRDRLKVVRAELKALSRLEREEAELKRLLAAAKQPPAHVTHITSARKSG